MKKPTDNIVGHTGLFATLFGVLMATGCATSDSPTNPGSWKNLFNGKNLDGWEVTDFAGRGNIEIRESQIHMAMGEVLTGIHWAGDDVPRTNFEVEVEAEKLDGSDFFAALSFPVGDSFCTFVPGGWGGTVVGLSSVNGFDAAENETATYFKFDNNQFYLFRVRVTSKKIEVWIDEQQVVDLELEDREISMRPGEIEMSVPLGVAAYQTTASLRAIRIRRIIGD